MTRRDAVNRSAPPGVRTESDSCGRTDNSTPNITLLTAREVADLLGVHVRSVWRLAQAGEIPAPIRISERVVRWRLADLEAHLQRLAERAHRTSGFAHPSAATRNGGAR